MEWKVLQVLVLLALGMDFQCCSGYPGQDFALQEALSASMEKVNSQLWSPYLLRAFQSSLRNVDILDEETFKVNIEFSVQETTCLRNSGRDPSTCLFRRSHYVPTATCRSSVKMWQFEVDHVKGSCHWIHTSASDSSEEMTFGDPRKSYYEQEDDILLDILKRAYLREYRRSQNHQRRARINPGFE